MTARQGAQLGFAFGFCAGWLCAEWFRLPLPLYLPIEHAWQWSAPPGTIAMHYFGKLLAALVAGALGAVPGRVMARRQAFRAFGTWAVVAMTLAAFGWQLFSGRAP
ncbi:MAG: hypothetical protein QM723_13080 [Myxococcaceae bacterium]